MSITVVNRHFSSLDMVSISNIKKGKISLKNTIVYVNSALFLEHKYYTLQVKNVKYETEGMIEKAWNYILEEKYSLAEDIFDQILVFSDKSYKTYFGKFVVCLFQNKDAYQYLKRTIETKHDNSVDDYYRIYIKLYSELIDIDDDYIPLLELLCRPKKIVAFNKDSYNGRFLAFLSNLKNKNYSEAQTSLLKCLEMKQDIYLNILKCLLEQLVKHQKELQQAYEKQELELEKNRSFVFAQAIKNKDLMSAKKALENIINYRNRDNKNNYIYYLFLELIETIELVEQDITFEIMPVDYKYTDESDYLYTFYEAISTGDFKKALEVGKKCRGKALDSKQNVIKVNLYVILLETLYSKLEERQKNIDNLYQLIINNIETKKYKHALELYNDNSQILKEYNGRLINYLLNELLDNKDEETVYEINDSVSEDNEEIEEIIGDNAPNITNKKMEEKPFESNTKPLKIDRPLNNKVTIFLRHNEPTHEYFQKYQICLVNKKFEEAKTWLDYFSELLYSNNIKKRLDYYYYQIDLGLLEDSQPEETAFQRKKVYFLAYNAILEGNYDTALSYLNYYIETDQNRDIRGYLLLGRLYTLMKKNNKAIEAYIKANAIAPNPDAYYFLGELYFKKHKWADAIFCYLAYNEFYPKENHVVYLNLAECYKRLGKSDKVVKYLRLADEINVEQKCGLYLKDRILKAEIIDKKKREHFLLNKENKGNHD